MINLGEGMSSGDATEEERLEKFQRDYKALDEWAKEMRQAIKHGQVRGVTDALIGMGEAAAKLIKEGKLDAGQTK
jgi:hypothetical protein